MLWVSYGNLKEDEEGNHSTSNLDGDRLSIDNYLGIALVVAASSHHSSC